MFITIISLVMACFAGSQWGPRITEQALHMIGKVAQSPVDRWLNFGSIGTKDCKLIFEDELEACEDIIIHGDEAFLACGNLKGRSNFYPPMDKTNASARDDWDEPVYKLNLKSQELEKLQRKGWVGDSILHGVGIWEFVEDPHKINLFFVNHIRNGSCITVFEHEIGTNELVFLRNICHSKIFTPNAVAPSGPMSFYFTNDHKFKMKAMRRIEDNYGSFLFLNSAINTKLV